VGYSEHFVVILKTSNKAASLYVPNANESDGETIIKNKKTKDA